MSNEVIHIYESLTCTHSLFHGRCLRQSFSEQEEEDYRQFMAKEREKSSKEKRTHSAVNYEEIGKLSGLNVNVIALMNEHNEEEFSSMCSDGVYICHRSVTT